MKKMLVLFFVCAFAAALPAPDVSELPGISIPKPDASKCDCSVPDTYLPPVETPKDVYLPPSNTYIPAKCECSTTTTTTTTTTAPEPPAPEEPKEPEQKGYEYPVPNGENVPN